MKKLLITLLVAAGLLTACTTALADKTYTVKGIRFLPAVFPALRL